MKEEGEGEAGRGRERREAKERGERKEVGGRGGEGREEKTVPIVPVFESTTGMVPIMGLIRTLCTRALTELATPLPETVGDTTDDHDYY